MKLGLSALHLQPCEYSMYVHVTLLSEMSMCRGAFDRWCGPFSFTIWWIVVPLSWFGKNVVVSCYGFLDHSASGGHQHQQSRHTTADNLHTDLHHVI